MSDQFGDIKPPKWPLKIIRRILKAEYLEEIEGDMLEEFYYQSEQYSLKKARYLYARETLKLIRFQLLKSIFGDFKLNTVGTYANYTKIAFRTIRKHKTYSFIKIGGFAIGFAISLLISLFVLDEMKTDAHLKEKPVYRLLIESKKPERPYQATALPPILGPTLKTEYPEVIEYGRVLNFDGFGDAGGNLFRPTDHEAAIFEERFGYIDPSIIKMLEFDLLYGAANTALTEPYTMLISRSKADKYFPNENPVGRTVWINEKKDQPYTISGVYADLDNSHLQGMDFFFTLVGKEFWKGEQTNWCCYNYVTYVQLESLNQESTFLNKGKQIHDQYFVAYESESDPPYAEMIKKYNTIIPQRVDQIYLYSDGIYDFTQMGDVKLVYIFSIVALVILLLACVNFINLTTANSAQRAKEIGLRKALGSGKAGIIQQFLIEALVMAGIAVAVGVIIAGLSMPYFNFITDKAMAFPVNQPGFYVTMIFFIIGIGLISGVYPAVYLSQIKTNVILGGQSMARKGTKSLLRNVLVVSQFAISMSLIVGAIVIYQQLSFILQKDLGYDKEQVLMIHGVGSMNESLSAFKAELENLPEVKAATLTHSLPVEGTHRNTNAFWKKGEKNIREGVSGQFWSADDDYLKTLAIELKAGRMFSNENVLDSNAVIVNESMVRELGLEDPTSATIENWREWKVIGVMSDFHFDNLKEKVRPLVLARADYGDMIAIKLQSEEMRQSLIKIEKIWNEFNPNLSIRTEFLDGRFEQMYEDVSRMKSVFLIFAVFAVIVACLGLFGLSVYTVSLRTKEMTIRKVLGATIQTILSLLMKDFLKLVLISLVIAIPVAWYFSDQWLTDFAYRIDRIWDAILVGAILLLLIAMTVVSFQSMKAAVSNPSNGLRNE